MRSDLRNNQIRIFLRKNVIAITHNFKFLDNIEIDRDNEEDFLRFFFFVSIEVDNCRVKKMRNWTSL